MTPPLRFSVRTRPSSRTQLSSQTPRAIGNAMSLSIIENATCTFCGCVCDDIDLHYDDVRIHKADHACVLGTSWFLNHTAEKKYPMALVDGGEATVDEAIERAATL